jgi:hypothetical protein
LACSLWTSNFTYNATLLASNFVLAAFTVEVYTAIVHPVTHRNIFNHCLVAIVVVCCWVLGIANCAGVAIGIAKIIDGVCYMFYGWAPVALPLSLSIFVFHIQYCGQNVSVLQIVRRLYY